MSSITTEIRDQLSKIYWSMPDVMWPFGWRTPEEFSTAWWAEEDKGIYHIGCPGFSDRAAMVKLVYAARCLAAVDLRTAIILTRDALELMEAEVERR